MDKAPGTNSLGLFYWRGGFMARHFPFAGGTTA